MKIAYFGYDLLINCLEELLLDGHEIVKIFTIETDNVFEFNHRIITLAENNKIPYTCEKSTEQDLIWLETQSCELIVCAGYFYRIPIEATSITGINIHPSILPMGRGAWPMPIVILKQLQESGLTIHKIVRQFDEGDMLLIEKYPVPKTENLETLTAKLQEISPKLLTKCINDLAYYMDNASPQIQGEYWELPTEKEMTFTPNTHIDDIDRIIRAFWGHGSYFELPNQQITINRAICKKENHNFELGEIIKENTYAVNGGFLINILV